MMETGQSSNPLLVRILNESLYVNAYTISTLHIQALHTRHCKILWLIKETTI